MEEEGVAGLLPGSPPAPWRFDPIPLPLSQSEFEGLEAGLAQRAHLLDTVLADLYGEQRLLADGAVPAALVYANPAFLRPCRHLEADRCRSMPPIWYARLTENGMCWRIARTSLTVWRMPCRTAGSWAGSCRAFVSQLPRHIDPFVELCLDMLRRAAPTGRAALLTPGHADPAWYGTCCWRANCRAPWSKAAT